MKLDDINEIIQSTGLAKPLNLIPKVPQPTGNKKSDPINNFSNSDSEEASITEVTEEASTKFNSSKDKSKNVVFVGTSLVDALDREKFERDLRVELQMVKVTSVQKDLPTKVTEIVKRNEAGVIMLHVGSQEIDSLDVNEVLNDSSIDVDIAKKGWFEKAEQDARTIIRVAQDAISHDKELKVIIIKQLPRFDIAERDQIGIKNEIASFVNNALDQELLKMGRPKNIEVLELKMNLNYRNIKYLVYGRENNPSYDGVTLCGPGAERHYSYRLIQAVKPVLHQNSVQRRSERKSDRRENVQVSSSHSRSVERSIAANVRNFRKELPKSSSNGWTKISTFNRFDPLNW